MRRILEKPNSLLTRFKNQFDFFGNAKNVRDLHKCGKENLKQYHEDVLLEGTEWKTATPIYRLTVKSNASNQDVFVVEAVDGTNIFEVNEITRFQISNFHYQESYTSIEKSDIFQPPKYA